MTETLPLRADVDENPLRRQGLGIELTDKQKLACALRILARAGCSLDVSGHITIVQDESGAMLCNPYGLWLEEVRASDICLVSAGGEVLDGPYDVSPAVFIHTELHRARHDATVIIHNHGHYGVLLGTMGIVPEVTEQQSCLLADEVVLFHEYGGVVADMSSGARLATGVGTASAVLLANHGCLSLAPTLEKAVYKAVVFERMCRLNYEALAAGVKPSVVAGELQSQMKPVLSAFSSQVFWEGAVRQLLAVEPEVML